MGNSYTPPCDSSVMGISSSCATRMALAFSVIESTASNSSADMLMEMVSDIDVAEGRSSSDLI